MKKVLLLALGLQVVSLAVNLNTAQAEENDTVIVVKRPNVVTIEKGNNHVAIEVEGSEGDADFRYSHRMDVGPSSSVIMEEKNNSWDFNIPFLKQKHKNKKSYNRNEFELGGFAFGLVNAVNAPEGMDVDMGASYELMADHLLNWLYYPTRSTSLSVGLGICWRNFRMTGRTRFVKEDDNIVLGGYPEGADIKFSRLKVFSLTVPLMLNQRIARNFSFSVGPVVNFNTHASLKTRYKLDGKKEKLVDSNIHQNRVTVDLMAQLKFAAIGLYVKYSPCNVLHTEYGPKFNSMSTGITLFY